MHHSTSFLKPITHDFLVVSVNCTGVLLEIHDCTVMNASMTIFSNGNETYDNLLLPIIKEEMDNGKYNDLHPAIINVTYLNLTGSSNSNGSIDGDVSTTGGSSGIQNPGLFAILGVAVVVLVLGFVWWKKKKDHSEESAEVVPQSAPVKARSLQSSARSTTAVQDSNVEDVIHPDETFDADEDEEFEC